MSITCGFFEAGKGIIAVLPQNIFLEHGTEEIARMLLGHYLCRETDEGLVSGMIVETEAYLSEKDDACHASRGKTKRNAAMFGPAGRAYIYFIYGSYHCFNVVTGPEGTGEAVLIRAVEPLKGLQIMQERRKRAFRFENLVNGPGKLCQAFAIDRSLDGHNLSEKPLYLLENRAICDQIEVIATPRIGISKAEDKLLRFIIRGSKYLSRRESI